LKVLSLDISSETGWSLFDNAKLISYGQSISSVRGGQEGDYPLNIIRAAKLMADELAVIIKENDVHFVVIEETNLGKNRYSQKVLEFFHCVIVDTINAFSGKSETQIKYLDSSEWRAALGLALSSDQRKENKNIKNEREEQKAIFERGWWNENNESFQKEILELGKRDSNKIKKIYNARCNKYILDNMRKFRTKSKKVNFKHLSVQYVNSNYDLNFKMKDNDIADSICLGEAFYKILGDMNGF